MQQKGATQVSAAETQCQHCCSTWPLPLPTLHPYHQVQVGSADLSTCWRRAWLGSSGGSRGPGPSGRRGSNGAPSQATADHLLAAGPRTALGPKNTAPVTRQGGAEVLYSSTALPLPLCDLNKPHHLIGPSFPHLDQAKQPSGSWQKRGATGSQEACSQPSLVRPQHP